MHKFFSLSKCILDDLIIIEDKIQLHHIKDVLRLKLNERVIVFDEKGNEYNCLITKISSSIVLNIQARLPALKEQKGPQITVACALPKNSKFDDIVDKLTQLGVSRIIPLETERVVIKLDKDKKIARQKRWERIALSSSQQSKRTILPVIEAIKDIKQALSESASFDLKLIPTLSGEQRSLKEIFARPKPKNILILVGPEGDFTAEEVGLAEKAGCIPVSLGDLVLRVETAAIAVSSFIRFTL